MAVPCGHCSQCVKLAEMELVQRVQMEAIGKDVYMMTTTYNNEHLPILVTSKDYEYRYARYEDMAFMIERLRENNVFEGRKFKWLLVSERGSKRARPHFHVLFLFNSEDIGKTLADKYQFEQDFKWKLLNYWERPNYHYFEDDKGKVKKRIIGYEPLCTYVESYKYGKKRSTYDFRYINPNPKGITCAVFYVLKYMLKNESHEEKIRQALWLNYGHPEIKDYEEAKKYWDTIRSRREYSLGFGLGVNYDKLGKNRKITEENTSEEINNYLRRCVNDSKREKLEFAHYFSPEELSTFPLANYYKKFPWIYTMNDEDYFFNLNPEAYRARYLTPEHMTKSELEKEINNWNRIVKLQEMEDIADDFDTLLNNI